MEVIPVHWDCRMLREGARNRPEEERVLYRPFVQLYNGDPWAGNFQSPDLKTEGYTLVVAGSSLGGDELRKIVKKMAGAAKAILVVDPRIPSALNKFDPHFMESPAETAAGYMLPQYPTVQPAVAAHRQPCVPRHAATTPAPPQQSTRGPVGKPTKGPAEDDLPGPSRAPSRQAVTTKPENILPFPQAFLPYATREAMYEPWRTLGLPHVNRADFIKSVRDRQHASLSDTARQSRSKPPRVNPYPKGSPKRYPLPSEHVSADLSRYVWERGALRRGSVIDLTSEILEEGDSEEGDSEEGHSEEEDEGNQEMM